MAKAKLSQPMQLALQTVAGRGGIISAWEIRTGTSVALIDRQLLTPVRRLAGSDVQWLLEAGAEAVGTTLADIRAAAEDAAYEESGRRAMCPDPKCARSFLGQDAGDARDRLQGHVSFSHLSASASGVDWGRFLGSRLSVERFAQVTAWLDKREGVMTYEVGDTVQRRGEVGPDCPVGVVKALADGGGFQVGLVSFSGMSPLRMRFDGLVKVAPARRCVRTDGSHANHGEPVDGMNCDPDRSTAEDERVTAAQREAFGGMPVVHAFNEDIMAAASASACGVPSAVRGPADLVTCPECREILGRRAQTIEEAQASVAALTAPALKFYRVRPGYYESNWGHSIERFEALNGNPMTWVILYPGETLGDVSRPTLAEAVAYVEQEPGDAPGHTPTVADAVRLRGDDVRKVTDATLWSGNDVAPTLADDVAALREIVDSIGTITDSLARHMITQRLDRIAGAVPQRATDLVPGDEELRTLGEDRAVTFLEDLNAAIERIWPGAGWTPVAAPQRATVDPAHVADIARHQFNQVIAVQGIAALHDQASRRFERAIEHIERAAAGS